MGDCKIREYQWLQMSKTEQEKHKKGDKANQRVRKKKLELSSGDQERKFKK